MKRDELREAISSEIYTETDLTRVTSNRNADTILALVAPNPWRDAAEAQATGELPKDEWVNVIYDGCVYLAIMQTDRWITCCGATLSLASTRFAIIPDDKSEATE